MAYRPLFRMNATPPEYISEADDLGVSFYEISEALGENAFSVVSKLSVSLTSSRAALVASQSKGKVDRNPHRRQGLHSNLPAVGVGHGTPRIIEPQCAHLAVVGAPHLWQKFRFRPGSISEY